MPEKLVLLDGYYYQQINGAAMESPLGPTVATVFLIFKKKYGFRFVLLISKLSLIEYVDDTSLMRLCNLAYT